MSVESQSHPSAHQQFININNHSLSVKNLTKSMKGLFGKNKDKNKKNQNNQHQHQQSQHRSSKPGPINIKKAYHGINSQSSQSVNY